MKYLLMVLVLLALAVSALAEDWVLTEAERFTITGNTSDTLGRTPSAPDSIRIVVTNGERTELFDAFFNDADSQCTLNGNVISFSARWEDVNDTASLGIFSIFTEIWSDASGNVDAYSKRDYTLKCVTIGREATYNEVLLASDTAQSILAEVVNIDAWNPITDNDSLVIDQSTLSARPAIGDTIGRTASTFDNTSDSVIVDGSSLAATDGAITATTIAPDAIGSSELAATAALEISDTTWDEILTGATHNVATSAGRRLRGIGSDVIATGTAQRGNATSIVLAAAESEADDFYNGHVVKIIAGTGLHQARAVEDYTGATDSVTLHAGEDWTTNPDVSSVYDIVSFHAVEISHIHDAAIAAVAGAATDTIFGRDSADVNAGAATSFGTLLMKPAYVQADVSALALEASLFDPSTDSVIVDISTGNVANGLFAVGADSVWARAVRALTDKAGFTLTASEWEKVWYLIDTANVDSSKIGEWLVNNLAVAGSLSAADIVAIADTILHRDSSDVNDGAATSFGTLLMKPAYVQGSAGSGSGPNAMTFFAIDTSASPDDTLNGVNVGIYNAAGSQLINLSTASDGSTNYNCPSGVIQVITALAPGYVFADTSYTTTNNDTVAIYGYATTIASPGNPDLAAVYNYEYDIDGTILEDAIVSIRRMIPDESDGIAVDSATGITLSSRVMKDTTDSNGFWSINILRTAQYTDTTAGFYYLECYYKSDQLWYYDSLYIPAAGNINMSDKLR